MPPEAVEASETGEAGETDVLDRGPDLIFAARTGEDGEVQSLLDEGVPISVRDGSGWTALKWAASEGHEAVLKLLLERDAAEAEAEISEGCGTPLHWAAYKGHKACVWRLLTAKPPLSPRDLDAEGNTPLHLAAAGGHLLILKTMLSQGVDVSLQNSYGNMAVQLSTSSECQAVLRDAAAAALDGRPYLCSCSEAFVAEAKSVAGVVIDRVSSPNQRPVRYSKDCHAQISAAEDALTLAMRAADVPKLQEAIKAADEIGASLPMIRDATAALERLQAQIALSEAVREVQEGRPLKDRALLRPVLAPLKQAREKGVSPTIIADADALCQTVDAEAALFDVISQCEPHKMADIEEGATPPTADSDFAKKAEQSIAKLAGAIAQAQEVEAMADVVDLGEIELGLLTAESELRKALLVPKEGTAEDGTPFQIQHNGQKTYSALEDLQFRNDFLDASLEKCVTAGTAPGIVAHAQGAQKNLKAALKTAQVEDEERKAKEAAAAAKAAKKGKKGKK